MAGRSKYEILGGAVATDGPVAVIRLRDVAELVKREGGSTGGLAYQLAPQTITNQAYQALVEKLSAGLKDQGVAADVWVAAQAPSAPPPAGEFLSGVATGVVGVGLGWLAWKYVAKNLIGRLFGGGS